MSTDFIHRYVPGESAAEPTILALHGTGGDESDLIPLAHAIAPRASILSPRGQVLEHGAPRFFRRLAEGVFDEEDLHARTSELAAFVGEAAARYRFDPAQVHAVGYSNGANIAASLLLSYPHVLAGAVLFRPMVPFEPATVRDLSGKRVYISAGTQDPIVPPKLTERLAALLREGRADVTTAWHPSGHALVRHELEEATRWFNQSRTV